MINAGVAFGAGIAFSVLVAILAIEGGHIGGPICIVTATSSLNSHWWDGERSYVGMATRRFISGDALATAILSNTAGFRYAKYGGVTVRLSHMDEVHWKCGYSVRGTIDECEWYLPYSNEEDFKFLQTIHPGLVFDCPDFPDEITTEYFRRHIPSRLPKK
jgi:uncharacterized protein YodC (DUF2158 family)